MRADTRGVGELLVACRGRGARDLALGLGGSGTVDGGTGMARALGFRFLDASGGVLAPGGAALARLARIEPPGSWTWAADANRPVKLPEVTALADVRSPLLGPDGAARRFAPQKGADADQVERLEEGLARLAERCARDLGAEVRDLAGAGAAGGLGAGCVAFLGARLVPGADWLMQRLGFEAALASADLVVTGEGAWDVTSGLGKVTDRVIERAQADGVPVLLVCGRVAGQAPRGVRAVDGGGAWLDEESLAALVARTV
jgi:glycerate kinase